MATDQDKPLFVWLQMLRDRNVNRRRQAAGALGCIGLPAVVGVVKIFKDGNHMDRYWALQALGQIGTEAKVALPVVRLAIKDRHANQTTARPSPYLGACHPPLAIATANASAYLTAETT